MANTNEEEYIDGERSRSSFFYRSLSPCSFERLRTEDNDYFYKPKRGPSTSKSNITITRPIKKIESVSKLVELLTKKPNHHAEKQNVENIESSSLSSKILNEQKPSSHYSSLLSMDDADASSNSPSAFSSRSNSSTSAVPEQDSQVVVIDEQMLKPDPISKTHVFMLLKYLYRLKIHFLFDVPSSLMYSHTDSVCQ